MTDQNQLLLATSHGLVTCKYDSGGLRESGRNLTETYITTVVSHGKNILAGSQDGVFRSADGGKSWQEANNGLSIRHIRWLAFNPDLSEHVFAGTEPAGIFRSQDGGLSWGARSEVVEFRDQLGWYLPYSPEAGCVRGFAFDGSRGLAAVEVGGVLVSEDCGETWTMSAGDFNGEKINPDVHSIAIHPANTGLVAAPTGGGFYLSQDGGRNWVNRYPGCYSRAVWWNPSDPEHLILGSAKSVDREGNIEETRDGGLTWNEISSGLNIPWRHHMVERFTQVGNQLYAVLSNGELWVTSLESIGWQQILPEVTAVHAVTSLDLKNEA